MLIPAIPSSHLEQASSYVRETARRSLKKVGTARVHSRSRGRGRSKAGWYRRKNHGLRTGFRLGDEILVQSAGLRVKLSLFSEISRKRLDPGVWSREVDPNAPEQGTRITIPYRRDEVPVPSGEGFILPHIELSEIDRLFFASVEEFTYSIYRHRARR